MTLQEYSLIVGIILGILTIAGIVIGALLHMIRGEIKVIVGEVKPNHGADSLYTVVETMRKSNDETHAAIVTKVEAIDAANTAQHELISLRLDQHAASPAHDRRRDAPA